MSIKQSQLEHCLDVMNKIKAHEISDIFFKPMNQIADILPPDYSEKITKFIDLSTIQANIQDKKYNTLKEWKNDCNTVWNNFYKIFNPNDIQHIVAKSLQETFNNLTRSMNENIKSDWDKSISNLEEKYLTLLKNPPDLDHNIELNHNKQDSIFKSSIYFPQSSIKPFNFTTPLVEGVIERRTSQFVIQVNYNGISYKCHCPTTGRVGTFDICGRPCLLSPSSGSNRKTAFTVEAVSLNKPTDMNKEWIGINQNACNRYVEHFLRNGGFSNMVPDGETILREQTLGNSKLDFLVGNTYLEVKMPLQQLQIEIPKYVTIKKCAPFSSTDRMTRHITELGNSLTDHRRAILLICFAYNNPGFKIIEKSTNYEEVKRIVDENLQKGVETWQANFKIDPTKVTLVKYFQVEVK